MIRLRRLLAALAAAASLPAAARAQQAPVIVTGRVTNTSGGPEVSVQVRIDAVNVGTTTVSDGSYRLVIPGVRVRAGEQVVLSAARIGLSPAARTITLVPGAQLTQNFQLSNDALRLNEIIAVGQGLSTLRARAVHAVSSVSSVSLLDSREPNVVAALAGKVPNVRIVSSTGDPGGGAYIEIRGANSVVGATQPLFVVDGLPIENGSYRIEAGIQGTAVTNRAFDVNPNDIAEIQVLKGGAATALYGSRGANGVVLITTRSGRAGQTRITLGLTYASDQVGRVVPLQTSFGRGLNCAALVAPATSSTCTLNDQLQDAQGALTWGAPLAAGAPVYDHAREMYRAGQRLESNLTLSGGTERTSYYLSAGRLNHDGTIVGPQAYDRTTLRLKATHTFADNLTVGGNFAFTKGSGDFVQQGSSASGIQLGALRTPPEFDNRPYLDPTTGYQRSYRCYLPSCTAVLEQTRGYDNPFWVALRMPNTSDVDRTFGNLSVEATPARGVRLSYVLGADYALDNRRTVLPKSSSDYFLGRMIRADLETFRVESRLLATFSRAFDREGRNSGSLSFGHNLSQDQFSRYQVNGTDLAYGADQLDFAVSRVPDEFRSTARSDGFLFNGELTLQDQLTFSANLLNEGSSTFGGRGKRFWYPGFGASWQLDKLAFFERFPFLKQLKVRGSYGVSGRQPPVYSNENGFTTGSFIDAWVGLGFNSLYGSRDGLFSRDTLGNANIRPERKSEWEAGVDVGLFEGRIGLGLTYYSRITRDMILGVPLPWSSGHPSEYRNSARVDNSGIEATLDFIAVQHRGIGWTLNATFAANRSCVKELGGTEFVTLAGFDGSVTAVVAPDAATGTCYPFGTFYGYDFVRFGRGSRDRVSGADIDATYHGPSGAIYIGENGFPQMDPQQRPYGDPNPRWTASLRNTFNVGKVRVSGLVDVSRGGQMWNGTRGALMYFGTHAATLPFQGAGTTGAFGTDVYRDWKVAGPGAGKPVTLNWATWTVDGPTALGSGFNGPFTQFLEDASFVKLRDVSVAYTLDGGWVRSRLGFSSASIALSGRNLRTWTRYSGNDPETNLTGQSVGHGLDYFNNPQTRSWVVSVNFSR